MDFICRDPKALVRAANVRSTLAAFRLLPDLGRRIVEKHALSIEDMRPDLFIPVQRWLDALREIQDSIGSQKLREVGRNIIENAEIPSSFTNAESILLALDQIYYLNHKGDVGHYIVSRKSDSVIEVRCETPYPRMFERGLIEGICSHKRAGGRFTVDYVPGPTTGDLTCTLLVQRT